MNCQLQLWSFQPAFSGWVQLSLQSYDDNTARISNTLSSTAIFCWVYIKGICLIFLQDCHSGGCADCSLALRFRAVFIRLFILVQFYFESCYTLLAYGRISLCISWHGAILKWCFCCSYDGDVFECLEKWHGPHFVWTTHWDDIMMSIRCTCLSILGNMACESHILWTIWKVKCNKAWAL